MNSVCIFCGSRTGNRLSYKNVAQDMAKILVENDLELVYGGGKVGIMGVIAEKVLQQNGKVTGVIPEFLYNKEVAHEELTKLIIVDSMHVRKQKMSELADAFIALPGGFGTLEELAEIITWNQLNLVNKPVGILNIDGFYDPLLTYFDTMVKEGFVDLNFKNTIIVHNDPQELVKKLKEQSSKNHNKSLDKT